MRKYFTELKSTIDTVLLSRKMAKEGFIGHWAVVASKKNNPQSEFAAHIANAKKVVFTKTLQPSDPIAVSWENTVLAKGELEDEVNKLKQLPGKDLIVYGGASFVSSLIEKNLIDEYYLFVNPVTLGNGFRIFKEKHNLKVVDAKTYTCGIIVLQYNKI